MRILARYDFDRFPGSWYTAQFQNKNTVQIVYTTSGAMVLEFQREPRIDSESIQDPDFISVHSSILSVKPLNSITRIGFGVAVTPTQTHYNVWRMSYYGSLDICGAVPADPVDPIAGLDISRGPLEPPSEESGHAGAYPSGSGRAIKGKMQLANPIAHVGAPKRPRPSRTGRSILRRT